MAKELEAKMPGEVESAKEDKAPDKYEIDNWVRTVVEAHEIMADPEKMKYVRPALAKKKAALAKVPVKNMADLKSRKANIDQMDADEEAD
jgi:hypothetical protein